MENPTAYDLMTRIEEIFALCDERQGIIETLDNVYGIYPGQDEKGNFVWYDRSDQIITKEKREYAEKHLLEHIRESE